VRERDCDPPPQDLVHVVQALKALTAQWIGHGPWLQTLVSAVCGQAAPPNRGCTTPRQRLCEPAPHDFVQVLQLRQLPTRQSTAHEWRLHWRVSALCGQALPPSLGCMLERVRFW
jgi:phosphohistidine phosphatase SixA